MDNQEERINAALRVLATKFNTHAIRNNLHHIMGWGQFLNENGVNPQVGPYGTCAGAIIQALNTPNRTVPDQLVATIKTRWEEVGAYEPGSIAAQNLRWAFLFLTLRICDNATAATWRAEVEQTIIDRRLPGGLWGDYYHDAVIKDDNESSMTSAFMLIAASDLIAGSPLNNRQLFNDAAKRLEEWFVGDINLPYFHQLAIILAVLLYTDFAKTRKAFRDKASHILGSSSDWEKGKVSWPYFFDYMFKNGTASRTRRDYFIIPDGVLEVLLFHITEECKFNYVAKLRARNFIAILEQRECIRSETSTLSSTIDQAWVAFALTVYRDKKSKKKFWRCGVYEYARNIKLGFLPSVLLILWAALMTAGHVQLITRVLPFYVSELFNCFALLTSQATCQIDAYKMSTDSPNNLFESLLRFSGILVWVFSKELLKTIWSKLTGQKV